MLFILSTYFDFRPCSKGAPRRSVDICRRWNAAEKFELNESVFSDSFLLISSIFCRALENFLVKSLKVTRSIWRRATKSKRRRQNQWRYSGKRSRDFGGHFLDDLSNRRWHNTGPGGQLRSEIHSLERISICTTQNYHS